MFVYLNILRERAWLIEQVIPGVKSIILGVFSGNDVVVDAVRSEKDVLIVGFEELCG